MGSQLLAERVEVAALQRVLWSDVVELHADSLRIDTQAEQSADHAAFVILEIDVEDVAPSRHLMDARGQSEPGLARLGFADHRVCSAGVEQSFAVGAPPHARLWRLPGAVSTDVRVDGSPA